MLDYGGQSGRVEVTPSAVAELIYVIYGLGRDGLSSTQPWHDHLAENRPDLVRRARNLFADGDGLVPRGYELFWVAAYTGYITALDPEPFLERLPQLVQRTWSDWLKAERFCRVADELTEARTASLNRLLDPEVQTEVAEVLQQVWQEIGPQWEEDGLPVVQVECAQLQQRLHEGANLFELLPPTHFLQFEEYAGRVAGRGDRGLVVSPLYFARGGYLVDIEMDRPVFIGYSPLQEGVHHATAQKAGELAARLKALSDPTRLTLLSTICDLDVTVGDLAKLLNVTQPSVSGHLRVLEKAGLVTVKRKGVKAFYRGDGAAIKQLLKETGDLLM